MKALPKLLGGASTLALAMTLSLSAQPNLLVDPGFELGVAGQPNPIPLPGGAGGGWAVFNGAGISSAQPESGIYSLQEIQGIGSAWNFMAAYQVIGGVSAGQQYTVSADFMTPTGITSTGYNPVLIQLTYFSAAGADLGTVETGGSGARAVQYLPAAANLWYNATVTATAPAGAAFVAPYLAFMENGTQTGPDALYWDNANMILVPEPSILALLGTGLALGLLRRRNS